MGEESFHFAIVDPKSDSSRQCLDAFEAELGQRFTVGFDPSKSTSAAADELTRPNGVFLVATLGSDAVGCAGLKFHREIGTAELKRMWVAPAMRGRGLGRQIVRELILIAKANGVRVIRLETNRALPEARHVYRAIGFREVPASSEEPYADYWYALDLDDGD
jgi:GNAT superfamily N-acetyltransferase